MRVGTASTYFEITCFGTAFEQPSGASNWEVAVTHSSWSDAEPPASMETWTLRHYFRRPHSQQREIELGSHGYEFIAT
jgi:hypothetical protein